MDDEKKTHRKYIVMMGAIKMGAIMANCLENAQGVADNFFGPMNMMVTVRKPTAQDAKEAAATAELHRQLSNSRRFPN